MFEIQEINPKTFNKDSYYTSTLDENNHKRFKKSINNYYAESSSDRLEESLLNEIAVVKYTKRFLNLCEENSSTSRYVSSYITSAMKVSKETSAASADIASGSNKQQSSGKFELPNNIKLLYKCTKTPEKVLQNTKIWKKKSENFKKVRSNNIKKVMTSKRNIVPYIESLETPVYKQIYVKNIDKLRPLKHRRAAK